jgi:hypothetical protein
MASRSFYSSGRFIPEAKFPIGDDGAFRTPSIFDVGL